MKDLPLLPMTISNYKMWNLCRKKFFWRNIRKIVPKVEAQALRFGGFVHEGLHQLRKGQPVDAVLVYMETVAPEYSIEREDLLKARAMVKGYFNRYGDESAKVVKSEAVFSTPLWNPETSAESKTFLRAGKIDAITQEPDGLWIRETKTSGGLTDGYLMRLWLDGQLAYYSIAAEVAWGLEIKGCVYDVLIKSKYKQGKEQSEADFAEKYAAACAKNKSGKTTLTRQVAESDEDFSARLEEQYRDMKMYHRERIFIPKERQALLEREIWNALAEIRLAKREDLWRQNTDACIQYGRNCPYLDLCLANGTAESLIESSYMTKEPNSELDEESDTET